MVLTDSPDPVNAGGTLTYTATVTNNSPTTATQLTVTDTLPAGSTFVSATGTGWTCTQAGGTVTCTRPTLATGAAPAITIVVTAPNAGPLGDTASVSATTPDPTPGNNSATTTTAVNAPGADLSIALTDAPDPVAAGGMLTYTAFVQNNSATTAATNLVVTDTLPAGVTFVSAVGTGWTCTQAGTTVTCTRATLAALAAAPAITFIVNAPAAGGMISDTATVSATTNDPTPGNNTATATTAVNAPVGADLSIALVDSPDPVLIGGVLTYTATVTDSSALMASTVSVVETFPTGFTITSATGTGWTCNVAGQVVTCTRATVTTGAAPAITVIGTAPTTPGTITAMATVSAVTPDPSMANNTTMASTTVGTAADLSVAVSGAPDPVTPGGTETFTITVTDSGPGTADNVSVTFTLPAGATFVSAMGNGWTCTLAGTVVTCTRPSVPPGTAPPIQIIVTMPATTGTVTTTVGVTSTTADPSMTNNSAMTSTTIAPAAGSADLAIALTAQPSPVVLGGALTYAIAVTNLGPDNAANVTVTDTLPADVTFISAVGVGWGCVRAGVTVSCTTSSLTLGPAPGITIMVTAPSTAETLTDSASVTATTPDPVTTNNTATNATVVGAAASADLSIALTDDGPVVAHHTLTYIATIANHGPDEAHDITVHVTLPSDVTSLIASNDWTCSSAGTLVTCKTANVTAAPINIEVLAPAKSGTAHATATVGAVTADPVMANNTAEDDAEVDAALTVRGGGCDTSGGSSGVIVLMAVAGLLLKRKKLAVVLGLLGPAVAAAQDFPVERMRVSLDRNGIIGTEWADSVPQFAWNIGTWIGLADDPLVVEDRDTGERVQSIVHRRLGGGLFGAIGATSWLEVGIELPLVYTQSSSGVTDGVSSSPKLGDIRFAPKLTLRGGRDRVNVGLLVGFTLQSNGSGAYAGDGGATFDPELLISRAFTHWRFSGNLGYLARRTEQFMDLRVDDELYLRLGGGYRFDKPVELDVTFNMSTQASHPFGEINTDPFEVDAAVQWDVTKDVTLFGLAGFGIDSGFGAPDWRVVAGIRYTRHEKPAPAPIAYVELDRDHDGIPNDRDKCPDAAEDKDGFQDEDGCPDPDNDGDGVLDVDDKCPMEPEDKDGFQDTDGCPDPDNDQDGVLDVEDKCPLEPGPAANQGCPDPDRDGDGVVDRIDNCPDEPGPAENHGCAKKQLVTISNGKLDLVDRVYFRTDKDIIEARSNAILDNVANVLNAHPEITKIRVEGHTDNRGGKAHNQDLSQRRAAAVVKYLVGKKVARERLEPQGFGQDKPIADNNTDTGRATNRRVEFVIVGGQGVSTETTGPDSGTIGK